jgi:hypothetical protein
MKEGMQAPAAAKNLCRCYCGLGLPQNTHDGYVSSAAGYMERSFGSSVDQSKSPKSSENNVRCFLYRLSTYVTATTISGIRMSAVLALIYSLLTWWIVGLKGKPDVPCAMLMAR